MTSPTDTLEFALTARLREVLGGRPATEAELRKLSEEADAWARTLEGQIQASERRLDKLTADPSSSLVAIATELRRVDALYPQLTQLRSFLSDLEQRARELRTEWLLQDAESTPPLRSRGAGPR